MQGDAPRLKITEREVAAIERLRDRYPRRSLERTARWIGVHPTTLRRILDGHHVCDGTVALVRARLVDLALAPVEVDGVPVGGSR